MKVSVKWSLYLYVCLVCTACVSIGRHTVKTPTPAKLDTSENRVVLVLLDRINHDVFNKYVTELRNQDYEPRYLSGISLLARNQFKLANAAYSQSAIPATTVVSEATIMTGVPPIRHGILSPRQTRFSQHGPKLSSDLTSMTAQTRFFLTRNWSLSQTDAPHLGAGLLNTSPWVSDVHKLRRTATVYSAFGHGTNWHLPLLNDTLATALFAERVSKQTTQVLDESAEEVVQDSMAIGASLTIFRLLAGWGYSCVDAKPGCQDESKSLNTRQSEALQEMDKRLWRLFRNYQMRMPNVFERTTFIISGTTGVVERSKAAINNPSFAIDLESLESSLVTKRSDKCAKLVQTARSEQLFSVDAFSGVLLIREKQRPFGQVAEQQAVSQCIVDNFQHTLRELTSRGAIDAIASISNDSNAIHVEFGDQFEKETGALERRRIETKLKSLLQPTQDDRVIVGLFLRAPYVFSSESQMRLHEGGLSPAALRFPFLLADKRLSQSARRQLEGASLDHIDFGPTIMGLLGLELPAEGPFDRQPLLRFERSTETETSILRFIRSVRESYGESTANNPLKFEESTDGITVTYHEDRSIWPPDELAFRLGKEQAKWTNTTQLFGQPNCTFLNDKKGRTWTCKLARPEQTDTTSFVLERRPALDGSNSSIRSQDFFLKATAPAIENARLFCRDDDTVMLSLKAKSDHGISSIVFEEEGIDTQRGLSYFGAESLKQNQITAHMCKLDSSALQCRHQDSLGLMKIEGDVPLEKVYERVDSPTKIHICSMSGLCRSTNIEQIPEDASCIF